MPPPFIARSASGQRVSLLNDEDLDPLDIIRASSQASTLAVDDRSSDLPTPPYKKQYRCVQCDRIFTTSGHLSRHSRVHSGEKNHHCPFPGCYKACSRQDNLLQHFRMHLPKAERNVGTAQVRAAVEEIVRAVAAEKAKNPIALSPTKSHYDVQEEEEDELDSPLSPSVTSPMSSDSPQTPSVHVSAKPPTAPQKLPPELYVESSTSPIRYTGRPIPGFEVSYVRGDN